MSERRKKIRRPANLFSSAHKMIAEILEIPSRAKPFFPSFFHLSLLISPSFATRIDERGKKKRWSGKNTAKREKEKDKGKRIPHLPFIFFCPKVQTDEEDSYVHTQFSHISREKKLQEEMMGGGIFLGLIRILLQRLFCREKELHFFSLLHHLPGDVE